MSKPSDSASRPITRRPPALGGPLDVGVVPDAVLFFPPAPPSAPVAPASRRWVVAAVLIALVAGGAAGAIAGRASSTTSTKVVDTSAGGRISSPTDIHGVLAKVEPGVVTIKTEEFQAGPFFPASGAGTGMVLTADGDVLTNAHVLAGASSITVTLPGQ